MKFYSRYENHSPSTTHTGNNGTHSNSERDENEDMEKTKDVRVKSEANEVTVHFRTFQVYFFGFELLFPF